MMTSLALVASMAVAGVVCVPVQPRSQPHQNELDSHIHLAKRQTPVSPAIPDCTIINDNFGFAFSNASAVRNNCCDIRPEFTCSPGASPRVISIDFNDRIFNMQIHSTIAGLSELTYLSVRNGSIPGAIPTEIGNLVKLQYLDLGLNKFQDSIPTHLGNLAALTTLSINNNALLGGTIPSELGSLKALQSLDLSVNALTGSLPPSILALPALNKLMLENNLLTGPKPSVIKGTFNFAFNCFDADTSRNAQCPPAPTGSMMTTPAANGAFTTAVGNSTLAMPASSTPNISAIVGGVVGGLLFFSLLLLAFCCIRKRKSEEATPKSIQPAAAVYFGADSIKGKEGDTASGSLLPLRSFDSELVPPEYAAGNSSSTGAGSSSSIAAAAAVDLQLRSVAVAPVTAAQNAPPFYATTESGMSSLTDPRRAVTTYRILPEKGRAFASATESDFASTRQTYAEDEKVSYSGRNQLIAEPEDEEHSFLDTLNPLSARTRVDEKASLQGAKQVEAEAVPEKNAGLFNVFTPGVGGEGPVVSGGVLDSTVHLSEKEVLRRVNNGHAPVAQPSPSAWTVEETAEWASKVEGVGALFAAKIKEHLITGKVLLQLTREELRTDFGLNVADRTAVEESITALKLAAGIAVAPQASDAVSPPSYSNIF